jgi:hypothetical protein
MPNGWRSSRFKLGSYLVAGLSGVVALNVLVSIAVFSVLLWVAWRSCGNLTRAAAAALPVELPALWFLVPRAETLALLPGALTYALLRTRGSSLWRLVVGGAVPARRGVGEPAWIVFHGAPARRRHPVRPCARVRETFTEAVAD